MERQWDGTLCKAVAVAQGGENWWKREPVESSPKRWDKARIKSTSAAAAKLLQSCLTLCNPIDVNPPGSPVPGILQARTLEWVAIPFSNAWKWKVKSEKWKWSRSVVSDSSRLHGLQPTRLLRPWDFTGKSTGVGCHCLLRKSTSLPLNWQPRVSLVLSSTCNLQGLAHTCTCWRKEWLQYRSISDWLPSFCSNVTSRHPYTAIQKSSSSTPKSGTSWSTFYQTGKASNSTSSETAECLFRRCVWWYAGSTQANTALGKDE